MDLREANIDPAKLLDFHDVMLSRVQADERVRRAWEQSNSADAKRRREELRQEWVEYHACLKALHTQLAQEHGAKAEALLQETTL